MTLLQILTEYQANIKTVRDLIVTAHKQDAVGSYEIAGPERMVIVESAFLRMFISWETFLENCFLAYLMNEKSISGITYPRYAIPGNLAHAQEMSRGISRYVDWSFPDNANKLAAIYLDSGEPFKTIIASIVGDLYDLKTIRNSAAHITSSTSSNLDSLATRLLKRPIKNITVYDLVLSIDPNVPGSTIMETYLVKLNSATIALAT